MSLYNWIVEPKSGHLGILLAFDDHFSTWAFRQFHPFTPPWRMTSGFGRFSGRPQLAKSRCTRVGELKRCFMTPLKKGVFKRSRTLKESSSENYSLRTPPIFSLRLSVPVRFSGEPERFYGKDRCREHRLRDRREKFA